MSKIRMIGCLFCLIILLASLAGCGGEAGETTTADAPTTSETSATTVAEAPPLCLVGGENQYVIVRAEEASDTVQSICTELWKTTKERFGKYIMIESDWLRQGDQPPEMANEILIGATNRTESGELAKNLADGTYRIKVVDRRVVICASADWMLENAVQELLTHVTQDAQGRFVIPGDLDVTGSLASYTRPGWKLDGLPAYDGGDLAAGTMQVPLHFKTVAAKSRVIAIRRTNRTEFEAYLDKVKAEGFAVTPVTDKDGVYAVRLQKEKTSAYAYLSENRQEVRVVSETGDDTPLSQFNYTYEKKPEDVTTVYQVGLVMDEKGIDIAYNGGTSLNCGHMYFIKLADNSIVVIDGGGIQQMSDKAAAELLRLFCEVTGTPQGQKVRVAGWFLSHRHPDHYNGFVRFLNMYHDRVDVERIFYNISAANGDMDRIRNLLSTHYSEIMYHKTHTGETIQLADVSFDVLHTLEDEVSSATGAIESSDFNDTSTVLRIRYDGVRVLLLGDAASAATNTLVRTYGKEALQCEILQVAHHGWNDLAQLYDIISPTIALYPQSSGGAQYGLNGNAAPVLARVKKIADQLYFAGDETVGVSVVNGVPTVTYRADVVGDPYTGWGF